MELVHNISKIKLNPDEVALEHTKSELEQLAKLAEAASVASLTILWQMLLKGISEVQMANNQLMAAEMIMIRLCYLSNIPTPAALIEKIETGKPITTAHAEKPAAKPKLVLNDFEDLVQLFHQQREMLLYQYLLNDVHLIEFEPLRVKIRQTSSVPHNFANKIAAFLQEWTGDKWTIVVSSDDGNPTLSAQTEQAKSDQIDEFAGHDMVQEVLQNFSNAKIKDISRA